MKELQDGNTGSQQELQQKIRQLERDKTQLNEKLELASRDQLIEFANLTKKYEKQSDQLERLQQEHELVKSERDRKINETSQKLEKEREAFNSKKREVEQKASKIESKQTELLLNHERERAKWDQ